MLGAFTLVAATFNHVTKTMIKGEVVRTSEATAAIEIVQPQPLKMDELAIIEQGERLRNWRKTWTQTAIVSGDEITHGGKTYLVHQVDDRAIDGGFYRVVMREITTYRA